MTIEEELKLLRKELRFLRQKVARQDRSITQLKARIEKQKQIIKAQKEEIRRLKEENKTLKDKLDKTTAHKNKLQDIVFKPNKKKKGNSNKRGAKKGHRAYHRQTKEPSSFKHCYLTNCPHCKTKLQRSSRVYTRVVEDIELTQESKTTKYSIEKQICLNCKKELTATPKGTLPYSPFGINTMALILALRFNHNLTFNKIQQYLKQQHNMHISEGAIAKLIQNTAKYFGREYEKILKNIRKAQSKHADETSWRIDGINTWLWLFATKQETLYTIEETRGKGIPQEVLSDPPEGVLTRDDYRAYSSLDMPQQSCWTHLLRVSREAQSSEAKNLHNALKEIFEELKSIVNSPFDKDEREFQYNIYLNKLQEITKTNYKEKDTIKIQTRVKNQLNNLLTALIYPDVELTNNHAERQIRPLVVQRKIFGGSRSAKGAKAHVVNMSIIQTLKLRGEDVLEGAQKLLTLPKHQFVVEICE